MITQRSMAAFKANLLAMLRVRPMTKRSAND